MKATRRRGPGRLVSVLEEPGVLAWYNARKLRSEQAADLEARKLAFVAEGLGKVARSKVTPAEILRLARKQPDRLRDLSVEYAARMKAAGRQDSYISKTLSAVAGWLKHNGVEFHLFPKLSPIAGETLKTERIPTPDELRMLIAALSLRGRVSARPLPTANPPRYVGSAGRTMMAGEFLPDSKAHIVLR
ncbi:MAG: hypothetical protein WCB19_09500 [Thermoplasmata archaeon]